MGNGAGALARGHVSRSNIRGQNQNRDIASRTRLRATARAVELRDCKQFLNF
ncbi:MAG TPA: hypothetical protein VFB50_01120 [Chloroflexota bacterium]|nr:hypothetical protein [Chloroflexota bacterium]